DPTWVAAFRLLMLIGSLVLVSGLGFWVAKRVVIRYIYVLIRRSPIEWDDLLADHKVFNPAAHLVPAILVKAISPALFADFPSLLPVVLTLTDAYLVIVGTWVLSGFTR